MDTSVMLQSPRPSRSILRGTSFSGVRLPGVARGPAQTRTGPRKAVNVTAILDVAKAAFAQQNGAKVDPKIQVEVSSLPQEIRSKLTYDLGTKSASPEAAYRATALSVRQRRCWAVEELPQSMRAVNLVADVLQVDDQKIHVEGMLSRGHEAQLDLLVRPTISGHELCRCLDRVARRGLVQLEATCSAVHRPIPKGRILFHERNCSRRADRRRVTQQRPKTS